MYPSVSKCLIRVKYFREIKLDNLRDHFLIYSILATLHNDFSLQHSIVEFNVRYWKLDLET